MRALRERVGTLVLVPLAVLVVGTHWTWERHIEPRSALILDPSLEASEQQGEHEGEQEGKEKGKEKGKEEGRERAHSREVRLRFVPDGSRPRRGVNLPASRRLHADLSEPVHDFSITVQAEAGASYRVVAWEDGLPGRELWKVPPIPLLTGLQTRRSPRIQVDPGIQSLMIIGDRNSSLSGLRVDEQVMRFPHWMVIPLIWGLWLLLQAGRHVRGLVPVVAVVEQGWRKADLWLAASMIFVLLFRVPLILVVSSLLLATIVGLVGLARRAPLAITASIALVAGLSIYVIPRSFSAILISNVSQVYDLTVDHRRKPDGLEINRDGIRFLGGAEDLLEEEFVVLFLGDSFTFGWGLSYEQSYPYTFETIVAEGFRCSSSVRAVNLGWTSSSPLLSLRLLREIGYKYRPDLVLYNLDMTDFHDDLRYEIALRQGADFELDSSELTHRLLRLWLPGVVFDLADFGALGELRRREEVEAAEQEDGEIQLPESRFFVTELPLEETRSHIERGVKKNLDGLHAYSRDVLSAAMALVLYPRAYQYSLRESPDNWEAGEYEVLGPFVREPLRYFEKRRPDLPYPVVSLWSAFSEAEEFPLFRRNDPHWTIEGAQVAARSLARQLSQRGLLPCEEPSGE